MALSVVNRPYSVKVDYTNPTYTATVTDSSGDALFTHPSHGLGGFYIYIESNANEYVGFYYVTSISVNTFKLSEYSTGPYVSYVNDQTVTFYIANTTFTWGSWNAVHNPIIYKLKSTLWPTNTVDTARTVSSYTNDLGYVKLTLSGTHETTELEFVKVTFTGGTTEVYQVLTWYSTTVITINLPYRGGITFVSVQKYYSDYHARIKIYAGLDSTHTFGDIKPYEEIAEIKAVPDTNGVILVNVNEYLKSKIEVIRNYLGATLQNDIHSFCRFYITYAECYTYSTGGYTLLDYIGSYADDSGNGRFYAANASLPFKNIYSGQMSAYTQDSDGSNTGKWLTGMRYPVLFCTTSNTLGPVSQYFDISFIRTAPNGVPYRVRREVYQNGVIVNTFIDSISEYDEGIYRYEVDRSSYLEDRIDLRVEFAPSGTYLPCIENISITVDDSCGPSDNFIDLSWKNNAGGHDYWRFKALNEYGIDIESTTEASKNYFSDWPNSWGESADTIDFETSRKSRQTIVVRAENLSKEQAEDLAKIKTSPLVQIVNDRTDRRTVILDKSSFVYVKEGERLYSLTFNLRYTDLLPSQSL